ncbi:MAG: mechanosensitive ion channel, partial [Acidobacteriota bacterium]
MKDRTQRAALVSAGILLLWSLTGCTTPSPIPGSPPPTTVATPQAAPPAAAAPEEEVVEVRPIPDGEIPARADLVSSSLRRIAALIEPRESVTEIYEELASRELRIEELRSELDRVNVDRIAERRLQDMRLPWLKIQAELTTWRRAAGARFDVLQGERDYLRAVRARWEATRDAAREEELGPELASQVNDILTRVIEVETRVRARRDIVASVIDRIGATQESISDALEHIDGLDLEILRRALQRDANPLWRVFSAAEQRSFTDEAVGAGIHWRDAVVDYLALFPERLLLLASFYAVALGLALRARRRNRARTPDTDKDLEQARALIERPFSVALATTLVASILVLPAASGSAADVVFALVVIPLTRLGSVLLQRRARRAVWAIVVLTLASFIASVLPAGLLISRVLLLGLTGVAAATAVRVAQVSRYESAPHGWQRSIPIIAGIFAVLLGFALAANVLGWTNLSNRLTRATVVSAFGGVAWAIIVAAFAALAPAIIEGRLGDALPSLRKNRREVIHRSIVAAGAIALLTWIRGTLVRFDAYQPLMNALRTVAAAQISIGSLTISAGQLIAAAVLVVITHWLARFARFLVRGELVPRLHLRRGVDASVEALTGYTIWATGVALAASAAGLGGTQLAVVIGALGVGIGFGLQTIVNNFVSGLILMFERPIKVGDAIETPDYFGRVRRIGIRASVIRSYDGAEIVVPNGELISKAVTNWTGTDESRRLDIPVGVAYGSDPEKVLEILLGAARAHPRVADVPPPDAQMLRFGDSSLDFQLRAWCSMEHRIDVAS